MQNKLLMKSDVTNANLKIVVIYISPQLYNSY